MPKDESLRNIVRNRKPIDVSEKQTITSVKAIAKIFEKNRKDGTRNKKTKQGLQHGISLTSSHYKKITEPVRQRLRSVSSSQNNSLVHKRHSRLRPRRLSADCNTYLTTQHPNIDFDSESENYFTPPSTPARSKQPLISEGFKKKSTTAEDTVVSRTEEATEKMEKMEKPSEIPNEEEGTEKVDSCQGEEAFDLKFIHTCFKRLESKVDDLAKTKVTGRDAENEEKQEKKLNELEQEADKNTKKLQQLEKTVEKVTKENKYLSKRLDLTAGTMQHMHQIITDLAKKTENLEISTTRKCLSLTGLPVTGKKKETLKEVEAFLEVELGIQVGIEDAYTLGNSIPPQIIFTVDSLSNKHLILQTRKQLKGSKNCFDQPYYINEYFPLSQSERKRREREILKLNDQKEEKDREDIEFKAGKMYIEGKEIQQQVREPQPDDILNLTEDEYDKLLQLPISNKQVLKEQGNTFVAYTKAVSAHKEIQDGYVQVRMMHPKARHVVCAYQLLDQERAKKEENGCDDQEPGAYRRILHMMRESDITSRVFYIARYCGKDKLSTKRFECYVKAAEMALKENPYNHILGNEQPIVEKNRDQKGLTTEQKNLYAEILRKQADRKPNRMARGVEDEQEEHNTVDLTTIEEGTSIKQQEIGKTTNSRTPIEWLEAKKEIEARNLKKVVQEKVY